MKTFTVTTYQVVSASPENYGTVLATFKLESPAAIEATKCKNCYVRTFVQEFE